METDRFQRLSEIFERAVSLPALNRKALLDRECAGDADLRAELEGLLESAAGPDDPVVTAAGLDALFEEAGLRPRGDHVSIPDVIGGNSHNTPPGLGLSAPPGGGSAMPLLTGQYRILRVVGEGGMGIVYEAEQSFPKRRVALKSIRPGMFSRRMLRRFQNEAHILGRLQHPGIAQIYEAGASDPQHADDAFFVMEFVDGQPLTAYAENKKLSTRARLELMIKVCDAVQHAHQRGVIHRDLKPANILVTEIEGEAQPKILDFGVARVTDGVGGAARADTMATSAGQLIGTLAYMSPEQISSEPAGASPGGSSNSAGGADTRADVYALGVTLYQLLTGKLPHDLSDKSIPDAARIVRETEPSRLGTIDRALRGDLETIAAKAMDKDRNRRYQSASELGDDLRRYLNGEAIAAKRDSAMYVLRKQIRRHKAAVAMGALALFGTVAFAVVAGIQAVHNRALADQLADQLCFANCERGRLLIRAGGPYLAERVLWTEHLKRPDLPDTLWALREYYSRQPILSSTGGPGFQSKHTALTPGGGGRTLVRMGRDGQLQGWTSDLSRCLWRINGDARPVSATAMAPDGSFLVLGGLDGKFQIIDPNTGATLAKPEYDPATIYATTLSPDARHLYVGDDAGQISIWNTADWSRARTLRASGDGIHGLSLSPDERTLIVVLRRGKTQVWDLTQGKAIGSLPIKTPEGFIQVQFSEDGAACYALAYGGVIYQFSPAEDWALQDTMDSGDISVNTMLLLDDATLLTTGRAGIRVWDTKTRTLRCTLPGDESGLGPLSPGPRPGTFYSNSMGTAVRLWTIPPGDSVRTLQANPKSWVFSLTPSPDGSLLVSTDSTNTVRLYSAATGDPLGQVKAPSAGGRSPTWRPRGASARAKPQFAAGFGGGEIALFEVSNHQPTIVASWEGADREVSALSFSADGSLLATGSRAGEIKVWNPDTHQLVHPIPIDQTRVMGVSFSPDNRFLASAGVGPGIALYDLKEDRLVAAIPDAFQNWRAKFSPDGSVIAAAASRGEVLLLDPHTLRVLQTLIGHADHIIDLGFDPTGQTLVTGSADHSIRFWSVQTGRSLLSLDNPAEASSVAFVPNSRLVTVTGPAGLARIWDLSQLDQRIARNMSYYIARVKPTLDTPADTAPLLNWARTTMADPAFSIDDPSLSAKLLPGPPEGVKYIPR